MTKKANGVKAENKELAPWQANLPAILKDYTFMNPEIAQTVRENAGTVGLFDLDRTKIPAGGGLAFEIPTLSGDPDVAKDITGIVVAWTDRRGYWPTKYGSGDGTTPPACESRDCVKGMGTPGGLCAECPWSQFGSAVDQDGKQAAGQACKQMRLLLIARPQKSLPLLLILPPTSVGPMRKFMLGLAGENIPYYTAVLKLSLVKDRNKSGTEYAKIKPTLVGKLPPEAIGPIKEYGMMMKAAVEAVNLQNGDTKE
jgi:hypothetical protein